jgi:pyrroloquinoline-quinone synthase
VEIGHSNNAYNAIAPYVLNAEGRRLFEDGISNYLQLLEAYWDGVDFLVREGAAGT